MALEYRELSESEFADWDLFCKHQKTATVFHTAGWLDQRKEGEFHILGCFVDNELAGGFPYILNRRLGLKRVVRPRLTPYYGPVWKDELKDQVRDQMINGLINKLYDFDVFPVSLHTGISLPDGTLPSATIRRKLRTCIKYPGNPLNYSPERRRQIRDGSSQGVIVSETSDPQMIYRITQKTFTRVGRSHVFSEQEFIRLFNRMKEHNGIIAFKAEHPEVGVIGAYMLCYDNFRAFNILNGFKREYNKMQAGPILMAHCIEWSLQKGLIFDFEGSAIEGVFEFFKRFGPEVEHYPYLVYVNSGRIKWLNSMALLFGKQLY